MLNVTPSTRTRLVVLPLLLGLLCCSLSARATTLIGGEQLNPGERAHEYYLGFPSVGYQWDFKADGKRTIGLQADILVWPFAIHTGLSTRTLMGIVGRSVISFRLEPGVYFGFFEGSRGFYENMRWGRAKELSFSIGPMVNVGIAASIDLEKNFSLVVGFESPVALWVMIQAQGWWVEWPILADVGLEYDISYKSTLFTKFAIGPSIGFAGDTQFAGTSFVFIFGMQTNYDE